LQALCHSIFRQTNAASIGISWTWLQEFRAITITNANTNAHGVTYSFANAITIVKRFTKPNSNCFANHYSAPISYSNGDVYYFCHTNTCPYTDIYP
jgi:hypothetical protein